MAVFTPKTISKETSVIVNKTHQVNKSIVKLIYKIRQFKRNVSGHEEDPLASGVLTIWVHTGQEYGSFGTLKVPSA